MSKSCKVYRLGLVPYQQAWELQERLAAQIAEGSQPATLLLLEHSHIFTFGRRGEAQNLRWDEQERARQGVEVLWVDRGGDITYHGPGQLVGYPLLPLAPGGLFADWRKNTGESSQQIPNADYVGYLRKLEETLILALASLGVVSGRLEGKTGVWVQPEARSRCLDCPPEQRKHPAKIAAIGVKVDARGISRHGFALNVNPDMHYWEGIIACGLAGHPAASLAELKKPLPEMGTVEEAVIAAFQQVFGYEMALAEPLEINFRG
jgi:lipoate-protein ligase B